MATLDEKIARVENNIKSSLEKVAGKGVTVPAGANSDNLPALIDAITQGPTLPTLTNPGAAADLLTGKELINAAGAKVTGSMPNRGAVSATLNLDTTSYTPAQGYHSGSGKVQVDSSINTTVDTQADLIAQIKSEHETQIAAIKTALEGKAAGGSGGATVNTCSLRSLNIYGQSGTYWATVLQDGIITNVTGTWDRDMTDTDIVSNVVCGSVFGVNCGGNKTVLVSGGVTILDKSTNNCIFSAPTEPGAVGYAFLSIENV